MTANKTQPTDRSADAFVQSIQDSGRRADCEQLLALMREITEEEPVLWGDSMVGFGTYHYQYASGREGDWFVTGFASRKKALTVYIHPSLEGLEDLLTDLGPHKKGKGCLYLKRLDEIDLTALSTLIRAAMRRMEAG